MGEDLFWFLVMAGLIHLASKGRTKAKTKTEEPPKVPDVEGRDCGEEWDEAYKLCRELVKGYGGSDLAPWRTRKNMAGWHSNLDDCARGFVSEECGGNPI